MDAGKLETEQKLIVLPCLHSQPCLFSRKIWTQSHSAKFLNWSDHVNSAPDLAISPPGLYRHILDWFRNLWQSLVNDSNSYNWLQVSPQNNNPKYYKPWAGPISIYSSKLIIVKMTFQLRRFDSSYKKTMEIKTLKRTWLCKKKYKNKLKLLSIWSKFCLIQEATTHRIGNQFTCPSFQRERILKFSKRHTINYRRVLQSILFCEEQERNRSNKLNGMTRVLSLGHLSFRIWSKQQGVINHWLLRQIDKTFSLIFSSVWILLVLILSISTTVKAN